MERRGERDHKDVTRRPRRDRGRFDPIQLSGVCANLPTPVSTHCSPTKSRQREVSRYRRSAGLGLNKDPRQSNLPLSIRLRDKANLKRELRNISLTPSCAKSPIFPAVASAEVLGMLDLFRSVRCLLEEDTVRIDNIVFRLHSRATVLLLLVCAILVSAKQYFGEPITCIADASLDKEPVNAYCWIYSTFTVSRHLGGIPGRGVASPGVGHASENDEIHYHRYYQWVCFVLGLQAILFYTPRALWGVWEKGTLGFLSRDLSTPFLRDVWTEERKRQLVDYFTRGNLNGNNHYAFRFFVCEALNFLNAVGQIYLLDVFLEGQFSQYGAAVTAFAIETDPFARVDPMARLFPKVTKCTIHTFGSTGSAQIHDALCVLPLNVVNEKIFVFIWFWLVFLAGVSGLALIYRIVLFSQSWARVYLLRAASRTLTRSKAESIVSMFGYGDWFLLHQLAQNVSPIVYRELVNELGMLRDTKRIAELL